MGMQDNVDPEKRPKERKKEREDREKYKFPLSFFLLSGFGAGGKRPRHNGPHARDLQRVEAPCDIRLSPTSTNATPRHGGETERCMHAAVACGCQQCTKMHFLSISVDVPSDLLLCAVNSREHLSEKEDISEATVRHRKRRNSE